MRTQACCCGRHWRCRVCSGHLDCRWDSREGRRGDTSSVQACYKSPPDTTLLNPARFCNQRNTNSKPLHTSDVGISQNNENDFILIFTSNFAVKWDRMWESSRRFPRFYHFFWRGEGECNVMPGWFSWLENDRRAGQGHDLLLSFSLQPSWAPTLQKHHSDGRLGVTR